MSMQEKRIKVVHLITRMIIGGAQENTVYTVRYLQQHPDFDVRLLSGETLGPEGKLYQSGDFVIDKFTVVPGLTREIEPRNDIRAFLFLYRYFRKEKIDIVHTHSSKAGIVGRLAAFCAGVPNIYHTIHGLPFHEYESSLRNLIYITSEKICAYITQKIISVCDTMSYKAVKAGVAPITKFVTVYSGMDVKRYSSYSDEVEKKIFRNRLGIEDDELVFVKVARLFELKGHEYIIRAAEHIIPKEKKVKFLFVGDGILRDELQNQIEKKGLSEYFVFTGLVPPNEVQKYIYMSDVVVHTSLREGLARVIPQGFLAGKPVISFDIDGAWELVKNNETGFLIRPGDVKGLVKAMLECVRKPERVKEMARLGREICIKRYPWQKMGKDIVEVYKSRN